MPTPRSPAPRNAKPRSKPAAPQAAAPSRMSAWPRLDLSRGRIAHLFGRGVCVCAVVGVMTVAAGWHASGMVRRGEIQKMVRMSASMQPPIVESKNRGRLDKGKLEALAASAAR